ncbi:hypothetical protein CaCOL14_004415 [Colletotrichum acutatum]
MPHAHQLAKLDDSREGCILQSRHKLFSRDPAWLSRSGPTDLKEVRLPAVPCRPGQVRCHPMRVRFGTSSPDESRGLFP